MRLTDCWLRVAQEGTSIVHTYNLALEAKADCLEHGLSYIVKPSLKITPTTKPKELEEWSALGLVWSSRDPVSNLSIHTAHNLCNSSSRGSEAAFWPL